MMQWSVWLLLCVGIPLILAFSALMSPPDGRLCFEGGQVEIKWVVDLTQAPLILGLFALLLPRITRSGLLFGVWVGSEVARGDAACAIKRSWERGMLMSTALSVALGIALGLAAPFSSTLAAPRNLLLWGLPACLAVLFAGLAVCYVRANGAARRLAPAEPPAPGVAQLAPAKARLILPTLSLLISVAIGLFCVAYAWRHYDLLPERWPTRLGSADGPEAWMRRSFATVMIPPLMASLTGGWLGSFACLLARAKRAVRREANGVSLQAQERFRAAMTRFLCGLSILTAAGLALGSVRLIEVGLGRPERLQYAMPILFWAFMLYLLGGLVYVGARVGQGGARLESSVANAPLTNGLADNTKWKLGFYVNRDDPSLFVEDRFGIGYGPNWGNPKAAAFFVGGSVVMVAMLAIFYWGVFAP